MTRFAALRMPLAPPLLPAPHRSPRWSASPSGELHPRIDPSPRAPAFTAMAATGRHAPVAPATASCPAFLRTRPIAVARLHDHQPRKDFHGGQVPCLTADPAHRRRHLCGGGLDPHRPRTVHARPRAALRRPLSQPRERPPLRRAARPALAAQPSRPLSPRTQGPLMAKEELIEMRGKVEEVLPDSRYLVTLDNGHRMVAYTAGRMKKNHIRILAGDNVSLELSPYDMTKGRITFRHLEPRSGAAPRPPQRRR